MAFVSQQRRDGSFRIVNSLNGTTVFEVSNSGATEVANMGAGVATFLGTPTSANLASAVTNETGSGALVLANTPTLVTPILGIPTSGTLTNCTLPVGGVTGLGTGVATFLATPSSANLASAVTGETGSGAVVFGTSPTIATGTIGFSTSNALTAVGSARSDALALTSLINNVTTAAASTGVILPAGVIGQAVFVFNAGANTIQVYGAGSDTIDTVAGSTGVPLTNAKRAVYICVAANTFISAQLGVVSA